MKERKAKICVPVCVGRARELAEAVARAAELGDLVEIRFDGFAKDELAAGLSAFAELRKSFGCSFIVTFRPKDEGGGRSIGVDERLAFWTQLAESSSGLTGTDLVDIESQLLASRAWTNQFSRERIISSHHGFGGVDGDLSDLYARVAATPAAALKIAVQAADATDCIPIFNLLARAQDEGREMIAIAIGQAGVMTRILGPSRGSYLTYGSLDSDSGTAPGQLRARELRETYRLDLIDRETKIMGVVGQPVVHSISPHIHNAAFSHTGTNAVFIPFEVRDLDAFIRRMVRQSSREIEWNLVGLSVTAPHKTAVMKHLDWVEPAAIGIGAVNTIVLREGQLEGYNTDAIGFMAPLKDRIRSFVGLRCAVIGAGGAARAVVWALQNQGAEVTVFARNTDHAKGITDDFGIECRALADAGFAGFDLVVNATPLGTRGKAETETSATAAQLGGVRLAYDLVYNPLETQFMLEARNAGCETVGGLQMLVGQAIEQSKLWMAREPDLEMMRTVAERALNI